MNINWQLVGAVAAFAVQTIYFTYNVTEKYKDVQTDVALVRQDLGFLRQDFDKLERVIQGSQHVARLPFSE